jgi:hypothetical protein
MLSELSSVHCHGMIAAAAVVCVKRRSMLKSLYVLNLPVA